jgi:hypothetical protein
MGPVSGAHDAVGGYHSVVAAIFIGSWSADNGEWTRIGSAWIVAVVGWLDK